MLRHVASWGDRIPRPASNAQHREGCQLRRRCSPRYRGSTRPRLDPPTRDRRFYDLTVTVPPQGVQATPAAARESRGAMSLEGIVSKRLDAPCRNVDPLSGRYAPPLRTPGAKHRATGGPEPGRVREAQRHDNEGSKPFSPAGVMPQG